MHNACVGRDRLDFVAEMLSQEWLSNEDLTAPEFLIAEATSSDKGASLEDFYAYRLTHSYLYVPTGDLWPGASVNNHLPPVRVPGSEKPVSATAWLDKNRFVQQMAWAPGKTQLIEGQLIKDGGWIRHEDGRCFNLYQPPPCFPGNPSKADKWVRHVKRVYPNDADHIIMYLAHRVQQPGEKINHALLLGGAPGIGKDTIVEPVKRAIGHWNFGEVSPQDMFASFNRAQRSIILRVYDRMKTVIAAPPDVLKINEKFLREYYVVCSVIITITIKPMEFTFQKMIVVTM
jgi:hypothetical protein